MDVRGRKNLWEQHRIRIQPYNQKDWWKIKDESLAEILSICQYPVPCRYCLRDMIEWCEKNFEGRFCPNVESEIGGKRRYALWCELESDAIAFKIRWADNEQVA